MVAPSVTHAGFIVPNASEVSAATVLAEPDRIDFNTMANTRWGIIEGCSVVSAGPKDVSVDSGVAIVNGAFVKVVPKTLQIGTPTTEARFDLVVVNATGEPGLVVGEPGQNPVYGDPGLDQTVLAGVYAKAGLASYADFIIDKRKLLAPALLTKIATTDLLVYNASDAAIHHFLIRGSGRMNWENDTFLYRTAAGTLRLENHLTVDNTLTVGGAAQVNSLTATGLVKGSNLKRTTTAPTTTGPLADLWQNNATGKVYIRQRAIPASGGNQWSEVATTESAIPVGTIIHSVQIEAAMPPGWYAMRGQTLNENTDTFRLFQLSIFNARGYVSGTAPNRRLRMPNLNHRVLMCETATATEHAIGKAIGTHDNTLRLLPKNIPSHHHHIEVSTHTTGAYTGTVAGGLGVANTGIATGDFGGSEVTNSAAPIDITPRYFTVYTYIRA